jgi:hypothetical protein
VEAGIIGSPEYLHNRTDGSINGWLDTFYGDVFNRPADDGGLASWASFAAGKSLGDVAEAIFSSGALPGLKGNEYRLDLVDAFYQHYLDRSSLNDPGASVWLGLLQAGTRYEEVVAEIVGDSHLTEFYDKTAR